jgi:hypothetical protein
MRWTTKKVARVAEWSAVLLLVAVGITAGMGATIALNSFGAAIWLALFVLGMLAALVAVVCWIVQCVTWLRCLFVSAEEQA